MKRMFGSTLMKRMLMLFMALFCLQSVGVGQVIPPPTVDEEDVVYTCVGVKEAIDNCISMNEWLIENNAGISQSIVFWEAALGAQVALQVIYINSGQPTPQYIIDNINIIRDRLKGMEKQIDANNQAIHNNYQLRVKLEEWYEEHCVGVENPNPAPIPDPNF